MMTAADHDRPDWLAALFRYRARRVPAVLVVVASVRGSAPREPGARMVVGPDAVIGTIGGGHLEHQAIGIAREQWLVADAALPGARRFALGASLGQCCGGIVSLWFELVSPEPGHARWLDRVAERLAAGMVTVLESRAGSAVWADRHGLPDDEAGVGTRLVTDPVTGQLRLIDVVAPAEQTTAVFGAGHVGRRLVPLLASCGVRVLWFDARPEQWPGMAAIARESAGRHDRAGAIHCVCGDDPVGEVRLLPAGAQVIVLTHSHALDEALAWSILQRDDLGWFGLIGSMTKRRRFEARLLARGGVPERVLAIECPIAVPGLIGKAPAVVALAIATRALQAGAAARQAAAALRRHGDSVK